MSVEAVVAARLPARSTGLACETLRHMKLLCSDYYYKTQGDTSSRAPANKQFSIE